MKLTEYDIRYIIKKSLISILNEVRYISSYPDFKDKNQYYIHNEPQLRNHEKIRVFHGTDMETALKFAKNGIDGTQRANRRFSYETGMNPHGLFVTTSFNIATDFFGNGNGSEGYVVLEFTADVKDLDTPVWNGQDTYFGQNSNPIPFRNKEERDKQKEKYNIDAMNDTERGSIVAASDNPALAKSIFNNSEHQALFFGQLDPNQIKRFWVKRKDNGYKWQKYNLSQFLKTFGGAVFYDGRDYKGNETYKPIKRQKLYMSNEDFTTLEDMMEREMKMTGSKLYNKRKNEGTLEQEIQRYMKNFKENMENNDEMMYYFIKERLFPKQAIQLLGKDRYNKIMGEVWR